MLSAVPAILSFGFLGLSFLMLYLGYRTMKDVMGRQTSDSRQIGLCKFFLGISLAFMLAAGPLQWVTMYFNNMFEQKSVTLIVALPNESWSNEFGEIKLFKDGEYLPIGKIPIKAEFFDKEQVVVEASSVIKFINTIRSQLQVVNERAAPTPEALVSQEGG